MIRIGDVSDGRDNNFNLIRAIAAVAVLVSHAHPIALGPGAQEPLIALLGHTLGTLAVFTFFILSGFLIATSYARSRSNTGFILARILRIYPGLFISVLFVMAFLGPVASSLTVSQYFSDPSVWSFIPRNMLLIQPQYSLPGVFSTQPYTRVEGSIWTLFHEVVCYIGVFFVGGIGLLQRRYGITALLVIYVIFCTLKPALGISTFYLLDKFLVVSLPFVIGVLIFVWQDRIPLSIWIALALTAVTWALRDSILYDLCLLSTMAYWLFWLAYVPKGWIRRYNQLGDYSYGIYIYAFPMQGFAIWLFGPQSPLENMIYALPLTILPSVLSWHYIEKPCLGARRTITARLSTQG